LNVTFSDIIKTPYEKSEIKAIHLEEHCISIEEKAAENTIHRAGISAGQSSAWKFQGCMQSSGIVCCKFKAARALEVT
jgi:hypothetical protein